MPAGNQGSDTIAFIRCSARAVEVGGGKAVAAALPPAAVRAFTESRLNHGSPAPVEEPLAISASGTVAHELDPGALVLDDQRFVDVREPVACPAQPKPQIVVLSSRECGVEATDREQGIATDNEEGRGGGMPACQKPPVNIAFVSRLTTPYLGKDSIRLVIVTPEAAIHNRRSGIGLEEALPLELELPREPFVVAVEEGNEVPARGFDPGVPRGRGAARVRPAYVADARVVQGLHNETNVVGGAVVDHQQLETFMSLSEYASRRPSDDRRAVESWDNYADRRYLIHDDAPATYCLAGPSASRNGPLGRRALNVAGDADACAKRVAEHIRDREVLDFDHGEGPWIGVRANRVLLGSRGAWASAPSRVRF
jgi:hypothetical protein